jgi:hypothetical protein
MLSSGNADRTRVLTGWDHSGLKVFMREVSQGGVTHYGISDFGIRISDFIKTALNAMNSINSINPMNGKAQRDSVVSIRRIKLLG